MNRFVALYRRWPPGFRRGVFLALRGLRTRCLGRRLDRHRRSRRAAPAAAARGTPRPGVGGAPETTAATTVGAGGSPQSTGTGSTPVACGGLTPAPTPGCAADEYCDYGIQKLRRLRPHQGICKKRPTVCDAVLRAPPALAMGRPYDNACMANAAGRGCLQQRWLHPPPGRLPVRLRRRTSATRTRSTAFNTSLRRDQHPRKRPPASLPPQCVPRQPLLLLPLRGTSAETSVLRRATVVSR